MTYFLILGFNIVSATQEAIVHYHTPVGVYCHQISLHFLDPEYNINPSINNLFIPTKDK